MKFDDILICPACKAPIICGNGKIKCPKCGMIYHIKNNVPILLVDKKLVKNVIEKEGSFDKYKNISKIFGSDIIADEPLKKGKAILLKGKILNIGSGSTRLNDRTVNMDISLFKNVDVVGDAHNLPFKNNSFDTVWCDAVLEHVRCPKKVVVEMYRVLKKGGHVFVVTPFIHKYHEHPNDFYRWTSSGLEELFESEGIKKEAVGVYRGPTSALFSFLSEYFTLFVENKSLKKVVKVVIFMMLFPLRGFDKVLKKNKRSHELACALYYVGRKV